MNFKKRLSVICDELWTDLHILFFIFFSLKNFIIHLCTILQTNILMVLPNMANTLRSKVGIQLWNKIMESKMYYYVLHTMSKQVSKYKHLFSSFKTEYQFIFKQFCKEGNNY